MIEMQEEWDLVCVCRGRVGGEWNVWFLTIGLISNYRFKGETGMQAEFREMSGLEM